MALGNLESSFFRWIILKSIPVTGKEVVTWLPLISNLYFHLNTTW